MKKAQELEQTTAELNRIKNEYELLQNKYSGVVQRMEELENDLKNDISPNHFRKTLLHLKEETEKLRDLYPIQDLVAAKEIEVDKTSKALAAIDETHSEFKSLDLRLKLLFQERDDFRELAKTAEEKFNRHLLRVRTAGLMVPFEVPAENQDVFGDSRTPSVERTPEKEDLRQRPISLTPAF